MRFLFITTLEYEDGRGPVLTELDLADDILLLEFPDTPSFVPEIGLEIGGFFSRQFTFEGENFHGLVPDVYSVSSSQHNHFSNAGQELFPGKCVSRINLDVLCLFLLNMIG